MLNVFLNERGLQMPKGLMEIYSSPEARSLEGLIYWPNRPDSNLNSLAWALRQLRDATTPPPDNYLPLLPVDDLSIACLPCSPLGVPYDDYGVARWHLGMIDEKFQDSLLATDVGQYVRSVAEELRARTFGLKRVGAIANRYYADYVEKGIRPRGSVLRPVQLACQNVIIVLAALRHDAGFDGLRVSIYLTCEAPHVATHEANRAMAALILCDAFQNGGTMEIRFGERGRENPVPPALRRFGRSIGKSLGMEDSCCITPLEARDLFLAVTPMPDELRDRCDDLFDRGVISPERLCFTLMSSIWSAIELDYIAATSPRIESILRGGAPPDLRRNRVAELETCRAAMMLGMLQRHIDNSDTAAQSDRGVRVFEDSVASASWRIRGDVGAAAIAGAPEGLVPWASQDREAALLSEDGYLITVPRGLPTPSDHQLVLDIQSEHPEAVVALLVPADMVDTVPKEIPLMVCPDRIAALDTDIERRLDSLRVGRL
jgi:hypothetical protein